MIKAVFFQDIEKKIYGFWLKGHAGYADYGKDIVCAAASVLAINTVNSIEQLTSEKFKVSEEDGELKFCLLTNNSIESQILLKSFALGLEEIYNSYGSKYISIRYKNKGGKNHVKDEPSIIRS